MDGTGEPVDIRALRFSRVHRHTVVLPTSFNSDPILGTQIRENMEHGVFI